MYYEVWWHILPRSSIDLCIFTAHIQFYEHFTSMHELLSTSFGSESCNEILINMFDSILFYCFSDENILYTSITLSLTFIWKYNFKKNVDTTNFHQCSKHEPRHERQWDGCCPPHGSIVSAWCGWFVFSILLNFIDKLFHTQYPSEYRCVFHHILYTFNTLCAGITPLGWANDKKTANSASSE